MPELTMVEALNLALARALREDESVILVGEDIGRNGGVFRVTEGLQDAYGADRVRDTPLSETVIAGLAIGLAAQGFRPVVEIQFMGFVYATMDQMVNHASRLRNRTRGRLSCPMVLRAPFGGGIHAPEHHSESTEAMFAHVPGLRVVIPSSPRRAYGLLLAAIHDPDPVVFLEPKRLYRALREDFDDDGVAHSLDQPVMLRDGADVTLVTWGAMVEETLHAANDMAGQGVECAVIDVATLSPLDMSGILASVETTGRCVIVHEAPLTGGFGAEIAARLARDAIMSLVAPVMRVTAFDTVMPLPRLEGINMPSIARVTAEIEKVMAYG